MVARLGAALLVAAFAATAAPIGHIGQAGTGQTPEAILAATAEKGKALLAALRQYTYYTELTIETVSQSDTITGKYYRFSQISYDSEGQRQERLLETTSTLPKEVHIGTNAANNLTRVYQFIITPEAMTEYEFVYVGRERVDELNTYVFDLRPRIKLPDPAKSGDRYLRGRVWVDDQDLCVVKVAGEALPEQSAHRTPKFETYYQNVDRFWFPAFVAADDSVRMGRYVTRVVVKAHFTSYKKVTKKG